MVKNNNNNKKNLGPELVENQTLPSARAKKATENMFEGDYLVNNLILDIFPLYKSKLECNRQTTWKVRLTKNSSFFKFSPLP